MNRLSPSNTPQTHAYPPPSTHSNGQPEHPPPTAAAATAAAALSQQHQQQQQLHLHNPSLSPNPATTVAHGKKRRASAVPGSRGVANLTPDQLAKKRANDREAQRAIRERTRHTIENLERRIQELEGEQPFQDLQRAIQERDRALADCEELRRRLEAVAGIVGSQHPSLNGTFVLQSIPTACISHSEQLELAALTAQQSPLPPLNQTQPPASQPLASPSEHQQQQHLHPDLRPSQSGSQTNQITLSAAGVPVYQSGQGSIRQWSPSPARPERQPYPSTNGVHYDHRRAPIASPIQQQQHHHHHHHHNHHSNGERLGLNFLLDSSHQHAPTSASPASSYQSPHNRDHPPLYSRLTSVGPASCPLDSLLIDFHANRRGLLHEGAPSSEVIGPEYPSMAALADPNVPLSTCHPVSAILIDILSKFPDISKLPEKIAVFYIMFLIMRWLICPCISCYDRLPEWCRPVPDQLEKVHPVWADYLPW